MKTLPVGTAYAVWTGIGAVGTVILGIVLFGEPATALRLGCVGADRGRHCGPQARHLTQLMTGARKDAASKSAQVGSRLASPSDSARRSNDATAPAGHRSEPTFADLFTPKLITVLREGYGLDGLRADALAGLTVAIVALPLSMAIAIGAGLEPRARALCRHRRRLPDFAAGRQPLPDRRAGRRLYRARRGDRAAPRL